jgi:hypothetical protein
MAWAETADVAPTETAYVAASAPMSPAAATAGLRVARKKGASERCTGQNDHHSSSHDILLV